jgi:hypothetical protein
LAPQLLALYKARGKKRERERGQSEELGYKLAVPHPQKLSMAASMP